MTGEDISENEFDITFNWHVWFPNYYEIRGESNISLILVGCW